MSFHFAYPNVLPKKRQFIGCGRYSVSSPDKPPGMHYTPVTDTPNTPNKNDLKRAVQLLAPASYDSTNILFHRQDNLNVQYQGDSLDLAWFLAHILRGYTLRCHPDTDFWATGVIRVDASGPHLLDVDPVGFALKLQAFLDDTNTDLLFIVPLANLDPAARRLCRKHSARIIRLGTQEACDLNILHEKTILTVPADGLHDLLTVLFCLPRPDKKQYKQKKVLAMVLLLLLGAAGLTGFTNWPDVAKWLHKNVPVVYNLLITTNLLGHPVPPPHPSPSADQIITAIENGQFAEIPLLSQKTFWNRSKKLKDIRQQLLQPLNIKGVFQYRLDDNSRHTCVFPSSNESPTLSYRDFYRLNIQTEMTPGSLHLYLFQVDSKGYLAALFPNEKFGTRNPIHPWEWPVTIPQPQDKWIFLDRLPESMTTEAHETLYLLASPWPALDIESLARSLNKKQDDKVLNARILAHLAMRRDRFPAICCFKWSFRHGR